MTMGEAITEQVATQVISQVISNEVNAIEQDLEEKLGGEGFEFPLLPQIATQVLALTQDENADAAAFSKLIHTDQSLAANLLRIANSPAYMGSNQIVSLQQAVTRLGTRILADIAFATSVKGKVFHVEGQKERVAALWKDSVASGIWAKEIARVRRRNVESSFMCGLLHEMGKPVALKAVCESANNRGVELSEEQLDYLTTLFSPRMGVQMGQEWGLPEQVIECIHYYRDYQQAPSFKEEAKIVHVASLFAQHLLQPEDCTENDVRSSSAVISLNLYPEDVDQLLAKADDVKATVTEMAL